MDSNDLTPQNPQNLADQPPWFLVNAVPEFVSEPPRPRRRVWLPILLFVVTCVSTLFVGIVFSDNFPRNWRNVEAWWPAVMDGLMYSGAVMTILLCHEMGHFLQAVRYGVNASLPYFIPMPFTPIGTFGAVIAMEPRQGDRKAVFDIGISGPLAGLVPTFVFLVLGLHWSHTGPALPGAQFTLGEPLLMRYLTNWIVGPIPRNVDLFLHPFAFAGWVGLLITSINLIPIGQLDGGHVLYGMFRRKAHVASIVVLVAAIAVTIGLRLQQWWLMLGLITVLGARHPPTADDTVPLGFWRYVLGILTLAFLFLGFTPVPISVGH